MSDPNQQSLGQFKETLECVLHPAEVAEHAKRLAQIEDEYQAFIEKKKSINAELNAEKAKLEAERAKVARKVKTEREHREVSCTLTAHFDRNLVVSTRDDTGEVVRERALRPDERQQMLKLDETKKAADGLGKSLLDTAKAEVAAEKKSEPCTATVLAGLCTVHGSECPDKDTFEQRQAQQITPRPTEKKKKRRDLITDAPPDETPNPDENKETDGETPPGDIE